jgi:hypothetical protein
MNWNQIENHLVSWKPRRPSPAIKKKLFGPAVPAASAYFENHLWQLLAPGFALFLGLCMLNSRTSSTFTPIISSSTGLVATVALRDPGLASYCADSSFTEHNIWPTSSFEWTNKSRSLTTHSPVFITNQ